MKTEAVSLTLTKLIKRSAECANKKKICKLQIA